MAEQMTLDLGDSEAENKRKKVEEAKAKVRAIAEEVRAEKDKDRKSNKDFEPKDTNYGPGPGFEDRDAVRSPVGGSIGSGAEMRSLNMGKKSKASKASSDYKKGGMVSSASKRADGCAIRGKTRA